MFKNKERRKERETLSRRRRRWWHWRVNELFKLSQQRRVYL